MTKIFFLLLSALCLACNPVEQPSGPDWGKNPGVSPEPEPEPTPDPTPEPPAEIVEQVITPTTEVAAANAPFAGLRYEPGISINIASSKFDSRLIEIANAGFKYIEITINHSYGIKDMSDERVADLLKEKQAKVTAAGLTLWSIHLPFDDANWTNPGGKESVRVQSVANLLRHLRLCAAAFPGCKNYVLHASKGVLSPRSESVNQARKSLKEMFPVAKELGVRICIENLVGSLCPTIDEMNNTIAGFEDAWVTFDIGHANCVGATADVLQFLKFIGPRLGTVHIQDTLYGSRNDDHRVVGKGDIDKYHGWDNVYYYMLKENRYRGVFLFELSSANAAEVMTTYREIVAKYKAKYESQ